MYRMGRGTSKAADKRVVGGTKHKIYSRVTYDDYRAYWRHFCDWLHVAYPKVSSLSGAAASRQQWADSLTASGKSAWTVRSYVQAVCKVTGTTSTELSLPTRRGQDITRSRDIAVRDAHYCAEHHHDLEVVCRAYGPRRADVAHLHGSDRSIAIWLQHCCAWLKRRQGSSVASGRSGGRGSCGDYQMGRQ
jgi:hypothetical protein